MITIRQKGDFNNIERFFNRMRGRDYLNVLEKYCQRGVEALKEATPIESGETREHWNYKIESGDGVTTVSFTNDHENNGVNVVILLVHGHGTRNGGYVQGNDFVTPALQPVFQDLADAMWKEVCE